MTLAEIQAFYEEQQKKYLRLLLIGAKGAGKTRMLLTLPRPLLIDSFDFYGEQSLLNDAGKLPPDVYVRCYAGPGGSGWLRWKQDLLKSAESKLFKDVKSYALDPFTGWHVALKAVVWEEYNADKMDKQGKVDQRVYWGILLSRALENLNMLMTLPCHVLMTGHVGRDTNEEGAPIGQYKLMVQGQTAINVPPVFSEYWMLESERVLAGVPLQGEEAKFLCPDGYKRSVVTAKDWLYPCQTRLGGLNDAGVPRLAFREPADFGVMFKKIGLS